MATTPPPAPVVREPVALSPTMCARLSNLLAQVPAADQLLSCWLDGAGLTGHYRVRITAATMEPVEPTARPGIDTITPQGAPT